VPVHPARPVLPSRPCPVCGSDVDPIRAREVVAYVGGLRYLCDQMCRTRFLEGERTHESFRPPVIITPRKDPHTGIIRTHDPSALDPLARPTKVEVRDVSPPWLGLGAAGVGAALSFFGTVPFVAMASAAATLASVAAAAFGSRLAQRDIGAAAWLAAPLGASLAAVGALLGTLEGTETWAGLFGAALAAAVVNGRIFLDERARQPIDRALANLTALLPAKARVPVDERSHGELALSEVDAAGLRTGEEVLCIAGEVVPVDGVTVGGSASVLPHPAARLPVTRRAGEPVLAGARVTDGALRLVATRVGPERAIARAARFGADAGPKTSPGVRRAQRVSFLGGILAAVAGVLALGMGAGLPAALSAVGAVLLAAPLVSLWRAATLPLAAAGAAAAARGITFASGAQLERAGRVGVCALTTRGTVTEGEFEVMELHPTGGAKAARVLSLVTGAEDAAGDTPIGRAIARYAKSENVAPATVRRALRLPGRGVTALTPDGESLVIGNRQLLLDEGVSIAVADEEAGRAEARGDTVLFVGIAGRVRAVLALNDPVRPGSRAAVQRLFDLGTEVVLLSGDHRTTAATLARQIDVVNVRAELLPEARGDEVRRLRETGVEVAVVGHPDSEDTALAEADTAIILGAAGAEGDGRTVALTTHDIRDAAGALFIAHAAREAATRATLVAAIAGCVVIVAAALAFAGPAAAALAAALIDAYALPSGARLLRRVDLRVPAPA